MNPTIEILKIAKDFIQVRMTIPRETGSSVVTTRLAGVGSKLTVPVKEVEEIQIPHEPKDTFCDCEDCIWAYDRSIGN